MYVMVRPYNAGERSSSLASGVARKRDGSTYVGTARLSFTSAYRIVCKSYTIFAPSFSYTTKESSDRVTAIDNASYSLGSFKAHKAKSEHMLIMTAGVFDTVVSESDVKEAKIEHVCPHCTRSFNNKHGLSIHVARWCGEADREVYSNDFEVDSILDARGLDDNRFYLDGNK